MSELLDTILERLFLSVMAFICTVIAVLIVVTVFLAVCCITMFAFTGSAYVSELFIGKAYSISFVVVYFSTVIFIFTRSRESVSDFVYSMSKK